MEYSIVLSDQAKEDIAEIYGYILNVLNRLYSVMNELSYMAESHHSYPDELQYSKGVHYFYVGNYSIFYVAENNVATVIHVTYGTKDLEKVLSDYK